MPYVKQEKRKDLDALVEQMFFYNITANGDLNYVLFAYCKRYIGSSYNTYKNYIGELRQCCTEIERKLLGPYEDEKIKENGDV